MEETEEIVKRGPGRPPNPKEPVVSMSDVLDMLKGIMAQQSEESRLALVEAIREVKKPSEKEQAEQEKEAERDRLRMEQRINAAKIEEEARAARQQNCTHQQENARTNFRAQVNTDGYYKPFCSYCQMILPKIKATDQQIRDGLDMSKWQNVSEAGLRRMAEPYR